MIEVKNLCKVYKHKNLSGEISNINAVDDISFHINRGEIFGLLGKNGAGKTTTIRMLTLQTQPTSGEIFYAGKSVAENELEMELHARLHHLDKIIRKQRIKDLLNYVELSEVVNDDVRKLSGGMKRRLLIIRALIHNPKILFLDEPTVALDPQVRRRVWQLIRDLKLQGVTIVLTTHYIEEAEKLCDRTTFISRGKLITLDTPSNLCAIHNLNNLEEVFIKLTGDKI